MECEICGSAASIRARVEGTVVFVCKECASLGTVVETQSPAAPRKIRKQKPLEEINYVEDFAAQVRKTRESLWLTREQLARKIREKTSVVERIERGSRPEKKVAEKLEKKLGIKLIDERYEAIITQKQTQNIPLTLGDVVEVKKKKDRVG